MVYLKLSVENGATRVPLVKGGGDEEGCGIVGGSHGGGGGGGVIRTEFLS